ncbi:ArsR/SmtB family transcription factor [Yinghuangia soli]|uniref:Transcriptional regulator n=1 Tax=Yinghuangia soli TaxID=2908204 RepID=A0AA41Q927_9ACTN|nr:transcriptional regulator [Yinghuangia soli]MCF2533165.1 transcriptional regulator [Yinghuangia soli]
MLRFHLATDDLNRLRISDRLDPMWEIAFSLHLLQNRELALVFDPWRHEVRAELDAAGLTGAVADLARLYPWADHFPDFLVPQDNAGDVESGVDRLLSTPRRRLCEELAELATQKRPLPGWTREVAQGDAGTLKRLGGLLRRYHAIAVAPYAAEAARAFAADRAHRAEAMLSGGVTGLLASFPPELMAWGDDTLTTPCPIDWAFHPNGRSMNLVPSFFCGLHPTAMKSPALPLTLTYPVSRPLDWLARGRNEGAASVLPLARLIGAARAAALDAVGSGTNTSRLADAIGVSIATASRHAAVLREAGLITSERRGQSVIHVRTQLGTALLDGRIPAV